MLRLSPSEIQNAAKLSQPQVRREGGTGRRSALRSIALPHDSPGRRSEPEMEALAIALLMSVIVGVVGGGGVPTNGGVGCLERGRRRWGAALVFGRRYIGKKAECMLQKIAKG